MHMKICGLNTTFSTSSDNVKLDAGYEFPILSGVSIKILKLVRIKKKKRSHKLVALAIKSGWLWRHFAVYKSHYRLVLLKSLFISLAPGKDKWNCFLLETEDYILISGWIQSQLGLYNCDSFKMPRY